MATRQKPITQYKWPMRAVRDTGHGSLVTGHWSLVTGDWSLVSIFSSKVFGLSLVSMRASESDMDLSQSQISGRLVPGSVGTSESALIWTQSHGQPLTHRWICVCHMPGVNHICSRVCWHCGYLGEPCISEAQWVWGVILTKGWER